MFVHPWTVVYLLRSLTQGGTGKDLWFMIGIIKSPVFEVNQLTFTLVQTIINPAAITSQQGTAIAPRRPFF